VVLNGEPLSSRSSYLSLGLSKPDDYQLVVMDQSGQVAAVNFSLVR